MFPRLLGMQASNAWQASVVSCATNKMLMYWVLWPLEFIVVDSHLFPALLFCNVYMQNVAL